MRGGTRSCGRRGPASEARRWRGRARPPGSRSARRPGRARSRCPCSRPRRARPARGRGRSGAGSGSSLHRPGRSRRWRRTRATCSRASRGRPTGSPSRPWPKYSTNFPTTPVSRRICVHGEDEVGGRGALRQLPSQAEATTCGTSIEIASPSIAASASIPPTPQPSTEAVDHRRVRVGADERVREGRPFRDSTTRPRNSRLTWWTIPVFGGTTERPSNAVCPQRRKA